MMHALTKRLTVTGTGLFLNGEPFFYQGISFFNALFNESFNASDASVRDYLDRFCQSGINALRVWCTWNFPADTHGFADSSSDACLFTYRGDVKAKYADRLLRLMELADEKDMVVETTALSQEKFALLSPKQNHYPDEIIPVQEKQIEALAKLLQPCRNHIFQIWNESSFEVMRYFSIVKSIDPEKIVTNSPGFSSDLGDDRQNRMLDILTPHTCRNGQGNFWEIAPEQIRSLLETYQKPVIDDEPARGGLAAHGGLQGGTEAWQHIEQIKAVRRTGAYHLYHHDMFQNGYGHPNTPKDGVPDPNFGQHKAVFDYLKTHRTWER